MYYRLLIGFVFEVTNRAARLIVHMGKNRTNDIAGKGMRAHVCIMPLLIIFVLAMTLCVYILWLLALAVLDYSWGNVSPLLAY